MERYQIIARVCYKENEYYILVNKYHNYFFLRILEDESVIYITYDEFKQLDNIFNKSFNNYMIDNIEKSTTKTMDKRMRKFLYFCPKSYL